MKTRIVTSAVIIAVMIAVLCLSATPVYPVTVSILAVIAVKEVLGVVGLWRKRIVSIPALVLAAIMPSLAYVMSEVRCDPSYRFIVALALALFVFMIYLFVVAVFSRRVDDESGDGVSELGFTELSAGFVLVMYVVCCFSAISIIRYIDGIGLFCLGMVLIGAWISDVFAYFTGMLFGKHKLIPAVSPKKTVEGAVGALIFTTLAMLLYGFIVSLVTDLVPNYLVLGLSAPILSATGQIGDLVASLIKRERGVKDYGTLLPGHGGIMDRFDSILTVSGATMIIVLLFAPFT
ncbi:MAG: hypothetical protein E7617_06540 [Ruminococcaceae bacterium]|nr:hypothetical protein [Oscillospiraceae bacterium]